MGIEIKSEGRVKLTKTLVEQAWKRRSKGSRSILRDKETAGLALVVNPSAMSWVFSYRPRGADPVTGRRWPNKTITLGNPASLSIDDARLAAGAMKGQAAAGDDPHAVRKEKQAKALSDRATTTTRLLETYEKALPTRPKLRGTGAPSAGHVADEIAHARAAAAIMDVGSKAVSAIDAASLRKLIGSEAGRPATARARFGAFSRFLDWAQDEGHIKLNPCNLVSRARRPKAAPARSSYLSLDQLAGLWTASEGLAALYRDLARFLIAIPCRRGEASRLDWSHLDLKGETWSQLGSMTKNGEPHRLHLHLLAIEILKTRHKAAGKPQTGLVFPAPRSGKPVDTFSDIGEALIDASGIRAWRWHDFRRSFASVLGEKGLPEPVLDACLNHRQSATRSGVLGVYQRAQRWPEQMAAMKAWGEALKQALESSEETQPTGGE